MKRTGCIYQEIQRNTGRGSGEFSSVRYVRGVGRVTGGRLRWVGEIQYCNKRFRFRSTNYENVRSWVEMMGRKLSD